MKMLYLEKDKKSKVFSGREAGNRERQKLKLDDKDNDQEVYQIEIPDVYSINASFFLGCFGASIRKLGENKFKKKYIFKTDNEALSINISDGIQRAVRGAS